MRNALIFVLMATSSAYAQFSFGQVEVIPITGAPYGLTIADFNNDSLPDIAVSVQNPDRVEVFANDGSATFTIIGAPLFLGSSLGPSDIVHADFDQDGDRDLAVAYSRFDVVRFLMNDGAGSFTFGALAPTGLFPLRLSAGALDSDNDIDLVVLNRDSGTVSVELNNGTTFTETAYPVGLDPRDVELGDFDDDGDLDFVTANLLTASLTFWYNDGAANFSGRTDLPTTFPFLPYDVDTQDIDNDSDEDVVVAGWGDDGQGNRVYGVNVFRSNGAGFNAPVFYSLRLWAGLEHEAVTLGDFDSDGDFDILGGGNANGTLDFLLNDGNGNFTPAFEDYGGNPITEMLNHDLNGDLKTDLAMTHLVSGGGIGAHVDYFLNTTQGNWSQLAPSSMSVERGRQVGGTIASLAFFDNEYLEILPGVTFSSGEAPVRVAVEAVSPLPSPSRLKFGVEMHSPAGSSIRQRVELFNFTLNVWEEIDARNASRGDEMLWFDLPAAPYLHQTTRLMRARVSCRASGPIFGYPWRVRLDRLAWAVR